MTFIIFIISQSRKLEMMMSALYDQNYRKIQFLKKLSIF